jgi:uncharacterized protein (DUF924 family)
MTEYQPILDFWFPENNNIPSFWFNKNKDTDDFIKLHFNELLIKAENHQLNHWKSTVKGHLALIILLDQFSRHIYRNDLSKLYKNDMVGSNYATEFLLDKKDMNLSNLEKMMVLMPFRHQENIYYYDIIINYLKNELDPIWDKFKFYTHKNYENLKKYGLLINRKLNYKLKDSYFILE